MPASNAYDPEVLKALAIETSFVHTLIFLAIVAVAIVGFLVYLVIESTDPRVYPKPPKPNPKADAIKKAVEKSMRLDMMAMEAERDMEELASYYSDFDDEEDEEEDDEDEYTYDADYEIIDD